jgi:hypothetical protein
MESSAPAWVSWVSLFLAIAIPIAISMVVFASKNWITARITKGVQHDFDVKLETLRAALRTSEEHLKSDLRDRETEIDALRNNVLSGSAARRTLLDKRRFEAVEKIWVTVHDLAPLKSLSQTLTILDYDGLARQARNPKVQQFLDAIDSTKFTDPQTLKNIARDERLFVPEIAWAYYSAFTSVLYFNSARFKVLRSGIEDQQKLITTEHIKKILKAALPHQAPLIDEWDPSFYYFFLDEIENKLLDELRKILDGKEADEAAAQQAKDILSATRSGRKEAADTQARGDVGGLSG